MSRFVVRVMPRDVILDVQGRTVQETLARLGTDVTSLRVGKSIEIEVTESGEAAIQKVQKIAQTLLYNPLLEVFEVRQVMEGGEERLC